MHAYKTEPKYLVTFIYTKFLFRYICKFLSKTMGMKNPEVKLENLF